MKIGNLFKPLKTLTKTIGKTLKPPSPKTLKRLTKDVFEPLKKLAKHDPLAKTVGKLVKHDPLAKKLADAVKHDPLAKKLADIAKHDPVANKLVDVARRTSKMID